MCLSVNIFLLCCDIVAMVGNDKSVTIAGCFNKSGVAWSGVLVTL